MWTDGETRFALARGGHAPAVALRPGTPLASHRRQRPTPPTLTSGSRRPRSARTAGGRTGIGGWSSTSRDPVGAQRGGKPRSSPARRRARRLHAVRAAISPTEEDGCSGGGHVPARPDRFRGDPIGYLRWSLELARLMADPVFRGHGVPRGNTRDVLLLPGFLASDLTLCPLGHSCARSATGRSR